MERFRLEKPNITEEDKKIADDRDDIEMYRFAKKADAPEYRYWDKFKFIRPIPNNLSPLQAWYLIKRRRRYGTHLVDVRDESGEWFRLNQTEHIQKLCHEFDMTIGGSLLAEIRDLNDADKRVMIANGIIEEAIASSQLEGADTGRDFAERILREGLAPKSRSEQMIVNNHVVLQEVEESLSKLPMSMAMLDEMHAKLTVKTLDDWDNVPHRRTETDEPLVVKDDQYVYHQAPSVGFVEKHLPLLVMYMNDEYGDYLHPVVKAIVIHFWIGYLHPYTDGNGRLARAAAHWYMLRHNYWGYSYLPISTMLKEGGKKAYTRAYVYAEQDDCDLTYFVNYVMNKMEDAMNRLKSTMAVRRVEAGMTVKIFLERYDLSERLALVMKYLTVSPGNYVTFSSHMIGNGIARATAAKDFKRLLQLGLVTIKKSGRTVRYFASETARATVR